MSTRKGYTLIYLILGLAAVAIIATAVVYTAQRFGQQSAPASDTSEVACTADAKQCPDGSYVSRVPPRCEFAECPTTNTNTANVNATADATKDWKTYTNTNYGYSVRFPAGWALAVHIDGSLHEITDDGGDYFIRREDHSAAQGLIPTICARSGKNHCIPNTMTDLKSGSKILKERLLETASGSMTVLVFQGVENRRVNYALEHSGILYHFQADYTDSSFIDATDTIMQTFTILAAKDAATKDWKKYKNNKYGFQMLHPKEWAESGTEIASIDGKTINLPSLGFYPSGRVYGGDGDITVQFRVYPQVTATLAAWFSENIELTQAKKEKAINGPCAGGATLSDISNTALDTTVASLEAKVQYIKYTKPGYCEGPASTSRGYYMKKGSSVYEIIASAPTGMQSEASLQTFDQAIATFQFTK